MNLLTPFRKQFILIKEIEIAPNFSFEDWKKTIIGEFKLYSHPDLELTHAKNENLEVFVLGFLLDWKNPECNNKQIVNNLLNQSQSLSGFIEQTFDLFGQFVIIVNDGNELTAFNDAAGTRSIFYKTDFSAIAST